MKIASNRIGDIIRFFKQELQDRYSENELDTIISWCFEAFLNISRTQLMLMKEHAVSESELLKFSFAVKDLRNYKPIQYILGEADFCGMKFFVNGNVLIPRPETEELVDRIVRGHHSNNTVNILDIGTGSGCIAITLAKGIPGSKVTAIDVSAEALEIAGKNALRNGVSIQLIRQDIISERSLFSAYDVIVSNPPYIARKEQGTMEKNVLEYEPHLALFVEDDDPLLFYRVIADLALKHLAKNGCLYFEINQALGPETQRLLEDKGFKNVELFKDLSNNNRILRGNI